MTGSWTYARSTVAFANGGSLRTARRRQLVGTLVLLVAIPALAATTSTAEVAATLVLDPAQLEFGQHEGYDLVSIEGAVYTTTPAEPMLPAFHVQLLLPPGSDCSKIQTTLSGTVSIPGTYHILPAPRPVRLSKELEAEIPQPKQLIYDSASPYPRGVARLAGVGSLGGYRIATVIITPLQYIPSTGELLLHTHIEVSVATEPSSEAEVRQSSAVPGLAVLEAVRATIANSEDLPGHATLQLAGGTRSSDVDYLIVCPADFAEAFAPLAQWKTRKGVPAEIVTLEEILGNPSYVGVDDAEKIRACIREYSLERGTEWVLLGGDASVLPAREAYDFFYDQGLPCDLYYADLDGSWDEDGDGLWGESADDAVDMYSDVFIGRAPVDSETEAAVFVARVLAYEGASFSVANDHQNSMLLLGEILWDDPDPYTDGGVALDMIEDESVPGTFDPITKLYQRDGNLSATSALAAIRAGYGLVVHQGHSNATSVSVGPDNIMAADLDALDNGDSGGLWYSVGCWSAAIDQDAFGEHWLTNPAGGGVAYVGNARYGWGCPGYPGQCVSDLYSQEFFKSLFQKRLDHAGLVHADAKHQFVGAAADDEYTRYAMYELNLLGDPETLIWTDAPGPLTVAHAVAITPVDGVAEVSLKVLRNGAPVEGARVCVSSADFSVYGVTETDAAGSATLAVATGDAGELMVTVTGRNCIPHGSSIDVTPGGTGVDETHDGRVAALRQNAPNPFGTSTDIAFSLAERGPVDIAVYDVAGRRVRTLVNRDMDAGPSNVTWDGRNEDGEALASGTYFVRMTAGSTLFEKKIALVR
jgi:hypothetical protein